MKNQAIWLFSSGVLLECSIPFLFASSNKIAWLLRIVFILASIIVLGGGEVKQKSPSSSDSVKTEEVPSTTKEEEKKNDVVAASPPAAIPITIMKQEAPLAHEQDSSVLRGRVNSTGSNKSNSSASRKKKKISLLFFGGSNKSKEKKAMDTSLASETSHQQHVVVTTTNNTSALVNEVVAQQPQTVPSHEETIVPYDSVTGLDPFGYGRPAPRPPADYVYVPQGHEAWGTLGNLTPEEAEALKEMKQVTKDYTCVEVQRHIGSFQIDDACLLRFLRARKFNVKKASAMLLNSLKWRDKAVPGQVTAEQIGKKILGTGICRFGPYSKDWMPVVIIQVSHYNPSDYTSLEQFTSIVAYFFHNILSYLPKGGEKSILFFDMKGWSIFKHATPWSMRLIGTLIEIIQDMNPERLYKAVLFNAPGIFSGTWNIIKGLLDPVVAAKVFFVYHKEKVLEMVDGEHLPVEYGGSRTQPYPIAGLSELLIKDT